MTQVSRFRSSQALAATSERTSESRGHLQHYDSSAAFEPEVRYELAAKSCELRVRGTRPFRENAMTRDITRDPIGGAKSLGAESLAATPPAAAPAPADAGLDRRALLAGAGAVVAGLGTPTPGAAQGAAPARAPTSFRRIDAHTHFSSLKVLDALENEDGKPFVLGRTYRSMHALTD